MTDIRTRREPPLFRPATVAALELLTPHLLQVTLVGPDLVGLDPGLPAASVRLLLPRDGQGELVVPTWNGNEFLFDDGERPPIRTLTPLRVDPGKGELDVAIVLHGAGPLSTWAAAVRPGMSVAVSGTGRGYTVDPEGRSFLIAGDESALPAITVLFHALPTEAEVSVVVEITDPAAHLTLPPHPRMTVEWNLLDDGARGGDALVAAMTSRPITADTYVWAAGEAAAVQKIRKYAFDECGLPRSHAVIRGYWKHGRGGETED